MAEDEEEGGQGRPRPIEWLMQRMPETGVAYFIVFVLAIAVGFLLVLTGHRALAMISFLVAIISILAMLFTPSPAARARRAAREAPVVELDEEEGDEDREEDEEGRPDITVDDAPAHTSVRPGIPAPPPEPPPLEDIVIDEPPVEVPGEADAGEDDDVWVE